MFLKKVLISIPTFFLYHIGEFCGTWDCNFDSIWCYNVYEKCMLWVDNLKKWAYE